MSFYVVKVALIAGVAGAVILSTGATAIAATREDPGVMAVSATSDDDGPGGDVATKKGSKEAKGKKKIKVGKHPVSASYAMYSATGPSETEMLENLATAPRGSGGRLPSGRMELSRDLLADGRR
jgi:hypothetical protein